MPPFKLAPTKMQEGLGNSRFLASYPAIPVVDLCIAHLSALSRLRFQKEA